MDVILLAGAKCDPALREATGAEYRCEIVIEGRTLLDTALAACAGFGPTVVVGPRAPEGTILARPGEKLLGSMRNGLDASRGEQILFVTADLPYIQAEHIEDFLHRIPAGTDLAYSIVPVQACYERFPGQKRTSLRVREGTFTGGNLIFARREVIERLMVFLESAYDARKRPLRLASLVGMGTMVRASFGQLVPGTLPLSYLEGTFSRRISGQAQAIVSAHPEVATDLDSLAQYQAATA